MEQSEQPKGLTLPNSGATNPEVKRDCDILELKSVIPALTKSALFLGPNKEFFASKQSFLKKMEKKAGKEISKNDFELFFQLLPIFLNCAPGEVSEYTTNLEKGVKQGSPEEKQPEPEIPTEQIPEKVG